MSTSSSSSSGVAIIALTNGGCLLAQRLASLLPSSRVFDSQDSIVGTLAAAWREHDRLVCIMATGIVVRSLAPLLKDKASDPAVVVCDEQGRFVISLLSGHLGGGNVLARQVASLLGGQAVITTASDVLGHTALDLWARDLGLVIADRQGLTRIMAKLVNIGLVTLFSEVWLPELPQDIMLLERAEHADMVLSCRTDYADGQLLLHPKVLTVGIGCNRGTSAEEIGQALRQACAAGSLALESVARLASIDLKKDEPGLLALAKQHGWSIDFHAVEQLNGVSGVSCSEAALRATGAKGVAEPAALLSSCGGQLLVRKMKWPNVTVAIALDGSCASAASF